MHLKSVSTPPLLTAGKSVIATNTLTLQLDLSISLSVTLLTYYPTDVTLNPSILNLTVRDADLTHPTLFHSRYLSICSFVFLFISISLFSLYFASLSCLFVPLFVFSCAHAILHLPVLVGPSVRRSVPRPHF